MYDGDRTSEWRTLPGKGKDAWVDIQLHESISIKSIGVQQAQNGLFKQMSIDFSNGESRIIDLGSTIYGWYYVVLEPPINTTSLRLSAQEYYTPEHIGEWFYRIKEIAINRGNQCRHI